MARPVAHKEPTDAIVKLMYGVASRCGFPECPEPLVRKVDGTDILNSTVAHIHARRQNGPRWDPAMSEADNRAEPNLILLCRKHSSEVDLLPDTYPAEMMRGWKAEVRAEWDRTLEGSEITDDQAREAARASIAAESVAVCVRNGATVVASAHSVLKPIQAVVDEWAALTSQATREGGHHDGTGMPVTVQPWGHLPRIKADIAAATSGARETLEPAVHALTVELRVLATASPELSQWCEWVDREALTVLSRIERPVAARRILSPTALTEHLEVSLDALGARWRGEEDAQEPPELPSRPPDPDQKPTEPRAVLTALMDRTKPWAVVTSNRYDRHRYDELLTHLAYSATLPPTPTNDISLSRVASRAASVARNADDATLADLIDEAAQLEPLAVSVKLLGSFSRVATHAGRPEHAARADQLVADSLKNETWAHPETWTANATHVRQLLELTSRQVGTETVKDRLRSALPHLTLFHLLVGIASWGETEPLFASGPTWATPKIRNVPDWLPAEGLKVSVLEQLSDLAVSDLHSDDIERRLAAEFIDAFTSTEPSA